MWDVYPLSDKCVNNNKKQQQQGLTVNGIDLIVGQEKSSCSHFFLISSSILSKTFHSCSNTHTHPHYTSLRKVQTNCLAGKIFWTCPVPFGLQLRNGVGYLCVFPTLWKVPAKWTDSKSFHSHDQLSFIPMRSVNKSACFIIMQCCHTNTKQTHG